MRGTAKFLTPFNSLVLEIVAVSKALVVASTAAIIAVVLERVYCVFSRFYPRSWVESPNLVRSSRLESKQNLRLVGCTCEDASRMPQA